MNFLYKVSITLRCKSLISTIIEISGYLDNPRKQYHSFRAKQDRSFRGKQYHSFRGKEDHLI